MCARARVLVDTPKGMMIENKEGGDSTKALKTISGRGKGKGIRRKSGPESLCSARRSQPAETASRRLRSTAFAAASRCRPAQSTWGSRRRGSSPGCLAVSSCRPRPAPTVCAPPDACREHGAPPSRRGPLIHSRGLTWTW